MNQSVSDKCWADSKTKFNKEFSALFYILWPKEETKDNAYDVPDYEVLLVPYFGLLVLIESLMRYKQGIRQVRFADLVVSGGSGLMHTFLRVVLMNFSIKINNWIYDNWRLIDLPLHSVLTWTLSVLLMELAYYWSHRSMHELNILWASHQYHHSPEDVSITATLRNTFVDILVYWVVPLPLALILPPPLLILHAQFSLIYQMWLHNSVVGDLGLLEYLVSTPRQHRLHHGKNPYCIDKNYGAVVMIWDRIFGTYQTEKEAIVYGIVSPLPKTFDFLTLQYGYYRYVWHKFIDAQGLADKLSALFKGPGWAPGKPRLGLITDVPEPDPKAPQFSYDPIIPEWKRWYIGCHGLIILLGFYVVADHDNIRYSMTNGILTMAYLMLSLSSFGAVLDHRKHWPLLEFFRCLLYFLFDYNVLTPSDNQLSAVRLLGQYMLAFSRLFHMLSLVFCLVYNSRYRFKTHHKLNGKILMRASDIVTKHIQPICLTLALAVAITCFSIAGMSRIQSCRHMLDQLVASSSRYPIPISDISN